MITAVTACSWRVKTFSLVLFCILTTSVMAGMRRLEYVAKTAGIKFSVPEITYAENKASPPQKIKIVESGQVILLGHPDNKELTSEHMARKWAPSGTMRIITMNDIAANRIEKVMQEMFDPACKVYGMKPVGELQDVTFGPPDETKKMDISEPCQPGRPVFVRYSAAKRRLVIIEIGAQDCIFYAEPGREVGDCPTDQSIVDSLRPL